MNIRRHIPISRRTLLRGAGASLALPWLEVMNGMSAASRWPVRMAILYMPNGVREDMWTPQGTGRDFTLSPTLEPLADLKNELVIATNLWNQAAKGSEGHYVKTSGFLTCTTVSKTLGVDINCHGISMDQVAARATGERTPIASLELGTAPVATGVDTNVGYTRVYGSHIAWSGPTSPVAKEINPRFVYERLLRATRPQTNGANPDLLLLDQVQDDARQLRGQLGAADKVRLDEYLSVVRALEVRVERTGNLHHTNLHHTSLNHTSLNHTSLNHTSLNHTRWKPRALAKGMPDAAGPPEGMPKQHAEHVRLMLDMIALAFQTDTTRIATFMFGNAVSNENFGFLEGVTGAHHSLSHHENDADKLRQYQLINRWHVDQYAYLLRKLRAIKEGERSLLDSSMIVLGAGLRDGNKHDPHNLPIVLAGRAGGRIATGQHLTYTPDTPMANLWMSMLDAFGTPVERFADSTGRLAGVLA